MERERERRGTERERYEESLRERWESEWMREKGKVPGKQICRNCMPTMNVNTL